jgi:hypothetical protein
VISAQLDPEAAGFPLQLYVAATVGRHDPRSTRVFEDQVRALPQITAADNVTGEMDYLLTVVARDVSELQDVLAALATRGGQRLISYLKLAEIKPPSRLPLWPAAETAGAARGSAGRAGTAGGSGGSPGRAGSAAGSGGSASRAGTAGGSGGSPTRAGTAADPGPRTGQSRRAR